MEFTQKKYTYRGMNGYAGFRRNQDYELELAQGRTFAPPFLFAL